MHKAKPVWLCSLHGWVSSTHHWCQVSEHRSPTARNFAGPHNRWAKTSCSSCHTEHWKRSSCAEPPSGSHTDWWFVWRQDIKSPKKSPSQCRRSSIRHRRKPPTWLPMAITKLLLPPAPTAAGNQGKKFWSSVCYLPSCSQIAPSVDDPPQDQRQNYSQK